MGDKFDESTAPLLHIHGQGSWHGEATIIGNRPGLLALKSAVSMALGEVEGDSSVMTSDGEGYLVEVKLRDKPFGADEWNNARLPYVDDIARDKSDRRY